MNIYVTGIGVISALGNSVKENWNALQANRTGIKPARVFNEQEERYVGIVNASNRELALSLGITQFPISRTALLGAMAAREAWGNNMMLPELRTGLISSTSVGGMDISEQLYSSVLKGEKVNYTDFRCHDSGSTSEIIANILGVSGYINTLSTACSSGVNALMLGARLIQSGRLDRVLVGGTDALTQFTVEGFTSLMIYDKEWCKPFDQNREGLNLGEGAGFLLLESERSLTYSGSSTICMLKGWANAADAYHQTASSPDGKGATIAIQEALRVAAVLPEEVSYINVHGTGTRNNDSSESIALSNVFGEQVPPFSSTKAFTGHTLAAAGAIEAVFSALMIQHQQMLPNLNFTTPMEETNWVPVIEGTASKIEAVLSNSFGFGGNNSSLLLTKCNQ